ncbi:MAG: sulfite exporter TauE/SafE family protein [Opitutales bacterium]
MEIDHNTITGTGPAFIAGLVTSLHCVGMCGPLACAFLPAPKEGSSVAVTAGTYHAARVLAYGVIGAVAGGLGSIVVEQFSLTPVAFLPWVLAAFFLLVGLGLDQRLPKPRVFGRAFFQVNQKVRTLPRPAAGGLLGFFTPFLPCGPLYAMFGLALFTGHWLRGAEFLLAFALGTLPLLFLVQTQFWQLRRAIGPLWLKRVQRAMALLMAAVITWRMVNRENAFSGLPEWCHF